MTTTNKPRDVDEPRDVSAELAAGFSARLSRIIDNTKARAREVFGHTAKESSTEVERGIAASLPMPAHKYPHVAGISNMERLAEESENRRRVSEFRMRDDFERSVVDEWRRNVEENQEVIIGAAVADVLSHVEKLVAESEHRRRVLLRLLDKYADRLPWAAAEVGPVFDLGQLIFATRAHAVDYWNTQHLPLDEGKPFAFAPDLAPEDCLRWGVERLGGKVGEKILARKGWAAGVDGNTFERPFGLMPVATLALIAHAAMLETVEALASEAARAILKEEEAKENDELASDTRALGRLELATRERLVEVRKAIGLPLSVEEMRALGGHDGLYELDARLLPQLQRIGAKGKELADKVKAKADKVKAKPDTWTRWANERLRLPRILARALWRDVVRPLLVASSSSPAALTSVVHADVVNLLRPGKKYRDGYVVDEDGRQQMMFTRAQALDVPTVEMGAIPHLLSRGVELLGSIQAHKVVRHFVVAGHEQAIAGEADARVLRYVGGWGNLAKRAGINSNQEDARSIIVALAHAPHALPNGTHGNLLAYSSRPHAPGRQSVVSIVLGDMLLPHFVFAIEGKGRTATENRQLVPVVDLPAFVGRPNEHGAQASFQMMLMARFRAAARELYRDGSVHIPRDQMETIAHRSGLTTALLAKVLELWTKDGDAPAFIVRTTTDKYTLAPHFGPALAYMKAAGSMSQARVAAGKASAARKGQPRKARRKGGAS